MKGGERSPPNKDARTELAQVEDASMKGGERSPPNLWVAIRYALQSELQ